MSEDIKEGFICPVCLRELTSIHHLETHFQRNHASTETNDLTEQLKKVFGKSKKKKVSPLTTLHNEEEIRPRAVSYDYSQWELHELGVSVSHTDRFKQIRDEVVNRQAIESNKLIMRLEKLIVSGVSMDSSARKEYEKTVVDWVNDDDVPFCPSCGRKFSVITRRHHCRVCGAVMCASCQRSIPFSFAETLMKGSLGEPLSPRSLKVINFEFPLQDPSAETDPQVKACAMCFEVLEKLSCSIFRRQYRPKIIQLYDKLYELMKEVQHLSPQYLKIYSSISSGEAEYSLSDGNQMRIRLMKCYEFIDIFSKKIEKLEPENASYIQLQRAIRQAAQFFLQKYLYSIQKLPTAEQYTELRNQHKAKVHRKLSLEKKENEEYLRLSEVTSNCSSVGSHHSSLESLSVSNEKTKASSGWVPQSSVDKNNDRETDPILLQMKQIKGYIEQARKAGQFDEVRLLQENLVELKMNYNEVNS